MSIDQTDSKQKQPISSELQKQISMELDQIRVKPTLVKNTPQKIMIRVTYPIND